MTLCHPQWTCVVAVTVYMVSTLPDASWLEGFLVWYSTGNLACPPVRFTVKIGTYYDDNVSVRNVYCISHHAEIQKQEVQIESQFTCSKNSCYFLQKGSNGNLTYEKESSFCLHVYCVFRLGKVGSLNAIYCSIAYCLTQGPKCEATFPIKLK